MSESIKLPPSLRKKLIVTGPSDPLIQPTSPSPLLSRLHEFLPKIAIANTQLDSGPKESEDGSPLKPGDVTMDLYVDKTLGELVPNDSPKRLIEELPSKVKP